MSVITLMYSCNEVKNSDQKNVDKENVLEEQSINEANDTNNYALRCKTLKIFFDEKIKNYKLANQAVVENDEKLFNAAFKWFSYHSQNPTEFLYFANKMALSNNYKSAYYYYFIIHDAYTKINSSDTALINHLYWYLAKAKELGYNITQSTFHHKEIFNEEIKSSDYYESKF